MKLAVFLLLSCASIFAQSRPAADVIVTNANVYTVDKAQPRAEAVAIIGDRIVALGTSAEMDAWRGASTKIIDAQGKLLLPGFNDAHVHFVPGGVQLDSIDLRPATGPEDFARRLAERVRITPKGEWITGGDWDEERWTPPQLPTRQTIDAVSPENPVFVARYDGHEALANSLALKLAGITRKTKSPAGGEIVRDQQGEPTGVLKDAAMSLVYSKIPPLTHERRLRAVKRAMNHAARLGVTSVQDMNPDYDDVRAYSELAEKGELTVRIYAAPPLAGWQDQAKIGLRHAWGSPYLRIGALKGYADGSLGSGTAYFFQPYTDDAKNRGLLADEMQPLSQMRDRMMNADAAGLQLCIHAIGDQAISIVLDLFGEVARTHGAADRRFRIEHAQHIAEKDFDRFASLNVIASMQPYHAIDDGRWAERKIGPERIKTTYAFRTLLDRGVHLAFGTDWNVAPLDPVKSLYAAVTRATLDGKNPDGWVPEQKIKMSEAVEAYTMGSAYAEYQEKEKGSITQGKLADMVLLSDDIFKLDPSKIGDVQVDMTIVGGKVVWSRQGE
ncbi:MAG TPA: amidohydrolase [Terriglobales bacterium]|nr:amidohydrolase [Terriglobales bacterium]